MFRIFLTNLVNNKILYKYYILYIHNICINLEFDHDTYT